MTLDLQALKAKLREYDKTLPKCPKQIERQNAEGRSFHPCCRPEGHEGDCLGSRLVLGWPGYDVLKELIEAYDIRRT
jgi:hypothetical protein